MKLLPTLALAALFTAGTAYASSTAPTATPASNATPAAAHARHNSAMHCEKEAKTKKLSGDHEKKFVKECRAGKAS